MITSPKSSYILFFFPTQFIISPFLSKMSYNLRRPTRQISQIYLHTRSSYIQFQEPLLGNQHVEVMVSQNAKKRKQFDEETMNLQASLPQQVSEQDMLYGFNTSCKTPVYDDIESIKLLESSICEWENIRGKPLERWLIGQNWIDLVLSDEYVYPRLVKEFYETLTVCSRGVVVAKVKGVYIELNSSVVNGIFNSPDKGMEIDRVKGFYRHEHFNKNMFLRSIISKPLGPVISRRLSSTLLMDTVKELDEFIGCYLLPHSSHHCVLSSHNIFFMWCIVNNIQVNFGFSFIAYMCDLNRKSCLPYSMLLTKIFKCFKIDLRGEKINFVSKSFAFCGGRRVITNSRKLSTEHINRFLCEGRGESSKVPSEESEKDNVDNSMSIQDLNKCPLSPVLSLNSLYLTRDQGKQSRGKEVMAYKTPCTPVQEFDELITSPNPEILQIAHSLKDMPLQDPAFIASSSKPPSQILSLFSPQNPQPTQNPSPCLTQTNPPGFGNLRNHPIYPSLQAAGRTNSGERVTLDGLMDKNRSMVFTLDAALAHTCQLLNHAKEVSQKSSSSQEQNNNFSLLQELRNNMEQMKDILVDHGTTLTILETQLCVTTERGRH